MEILLFLLCHWYLSLFFQTFFLHRYASHKMFKMHPFLEKLLIDACISFGENKLIDGLQDLGAAGLSSAITEMGKDSGLGVDLNLDAIHTRESELTAYELDSIVKEVNSMEELSIKHGVPKESVYFLKANFR